MTMSKDFYVVGYPSKVGGADTELDQQIDVWQKLGITVHLIHTQALDANAKAMGMEKRGCIIHEPSDWKAINGGHVISYCNGRFLKHLPEIRKYAATTTFVNCMTFIFQNEKKMANQGLIDYEIYQTSRVMEKNFPEIQKLHPPCKNFLIKPYFNISSFPFYKDRPQNNFNFGRIHREDLSKFHPNTFWIYDTMVAPVMKRGIILGYNKVIEKKLRRRPPAWIRTYPAGGLSQADFYKETEVIIQCCDPKHNENLPRIAFEAMSSGTLLIVGDYGGWQDLVEHGVTGWRCKNERDFVYYSSRAAYEHEERKKMIEAAREKVASQWGSIDSACEQWTPYFKELGLL